MPTKKDTPAGHVVTDFYRDANRIESRGHLYYRLAMSIAELKAEVDRLSPEERRQLGNYIAAKNYVMTDEMRKELTAKIDDNDPSHWMTLEEFGKRLGLEQ